MLLQYFFFWSTLWISTLNTVCISSQSNASICLSTASKELIVTLFFWRWSKSHRNTQGFVCLIDHYVITEGKTVDNRYLIYFASIKQSSNLNKLNQFSWVSKTINKQSTNMYCTQDAMKIHSYRTWVKRNQKFWNAKFLARLICQLHAFFFSQFNKFTLNLSPSYLFFF